VTISGTPSPYESFDGTYTLGGKTGDPECCWTGFNESALQDLTICYEEGVEITASFSGGVAQYAGFGDIDICAGDVVLSKLIGSPAEFPATITVTATP
jgi:hypothetical protein